MDVLTDVQGKPRKDDQRREAKGGQGSPRGQVDGAPDDGVLASHAAHLPGRFMSNSGVSMSQGPLTIRGASVSC